MKSTIRVRFQLPGQKHWSVCSHDEAQRWIRHWGFTLLPRRERSVATYFLQAANGCSYIQLRAAGGAS